MSNRAAESIERHRGDRTTGCRLCGGALAQTFIDLGMSPLCESFLTREQLDDMEPYYPLHALVCGHCFLVQLKEYVSPGDIFREYAYFSSYSTTWVAHAKAYCTTMVERLRLGPSSLVVELASNDGYLLQHFLPLGIPVLGIEPAVNIAEVAIARGIETRVRFFGQRFALELASEGKQADLIVANNVLAQVPDLNDFVAGMRQLLKPDGVITIEFPHLGRLVAENQFDTIYHEHFSYFSFSTVARLMTQHQLRIVDVEQLPTHGGSLRVHAAHQGSGRPVSACVAQLLAQEAAQGFSDIATYAAFAARVQQTKRRLLAFLVAAKEEGKTICGYGAPGKGNTLLNYCGIGRDFLEFTVDRNPYKQGRFTPGMHIPIRHVEAIDEAKPDYILILPWNLKHEIIAQMRHIGDWGGKFVVPIPEVSVIDPTEWKS
jgi:C-methyltransferase C-terminal domain/Putative zinc binding domain/Methyltransferase domain